MGLVRLQGPGGQFTAPIGVDGSRPDVASFFKVPSGEHSGFLGTYFVRKLSPGAYAATIYRRSPKGWIACLGRQALTAP